jgi:hypothetical protein
MVEPVRVQNWSAGANNIASRDRLPPNSVRAAVNLDPLPGGRLALRAGFERVYAGTAPRAVLALGGRLLIADGADLVEFDARTNSARVLRSIAGAGPMVGDELNGRLYFCTASEALEYDGQTVRPWGVPDVLQQPAISAALGGTLLAGHYQVAMTYTDQWGREGGTDRPAIIQAPAGGRLDIVVPGIPSGCTANLYVGAVGGSTLYLQRRVQAAGTVEIGSVNDDTARCETILARAPQVGHLVSAHNSVLAVAVDRHVQITRSMRPHLVDRVSGFFQYPAPVGVLLSAAGTLFVSSDKVYALAGLETAEVAQVVAQEYPATPGTAVRLPDGRGAWMTRYGQAVASAEGVQLLTRDTYAPVQADSGAAGVLDHNGNQLIVSVLGGLLGRSPLASTDRFKELNP